LPRLLNMLCFIVAALRTAWCQANAETAFNVEASLVFKDHSLLSTGLFIFALFLFFSIALLAN
jgi:hypothetical protein